MEALHYLLMKTHTNLNRWIVNEAADLHLSPGQPKVLEYLMEHDGAEQREIAMGCHVEAPSLTSILNRMERDGLIERRMLHGNRRSYHIFVTAKGKEKQQRVAEGFAEVETCAFEGVADAEKAAFLHTFAILYENLQRIGESK